jgi:hypothetical protein
MPGSELFGKEIVIRVADGDLGFIYSVKCVGVTLWRCFVPVEGATKGLLVRHEATKSDKRDTRNDDAR